MKTQTPAPGRPVFESELLTEFDDGSEEARFTDAEWAIMMADPARFGYTCARGHAWSDAERYHGHCASCFAASEADEA